MKHSRTYRRVAEGIYERHGTYNVRLTQGAKARWVKLEATTLPEARREKARLRAEAAPSTSMTVAEWESQWLALHPKRSESTERWARERVSRFVGDFGHRPLEDISSIEARYWILGGTVPPGPTARIAATWEGSEVHADGSVTVRHHRSHLPAVRSMLNDATKETVRGGRRILQDSPLQGVSVPTSRGRSDFQMIDRRELEVLIATAEEIWGDYGASMFGPMIRFAAWTGLRPGELAAIRPLDLIIDEDPRIRVHRQWSSDLRRFVPHTKTYLDREVALLPEAQRAISRIPRRRPHEVIFIPPQAAGRRNRLGVMTGGVLAYYWRPVRDAFKAGLPPGHWLRARDRRLDFYELRHIFGTELAMNGASPFEIADQMGNSVEVAVKTYIHPRRGDIRANVRARFEEAV